MKQKLGALLTSIGVVACVAISMQRMEAQESITMYSAAPMQLTITARAGQSLATLDIPAGVEVSITGTGEPPSGDRRTLPATFSGDVSIRTRLKSELPAGSSLRDRMATAPFRLDVQDAVVVVTRRQ